MGCDASITIKIAAKWSISTYRVAGLLDTFYPINSVISLVAVNRGKIYPFTKQNWRFLYHVPHLFSHITCLFNTQFTPVTLNGFVTIDYFSFTRAWVVFSLNLSEIIVVVEMK